MSMRERSPRPGATISPPVGCSMVYGCTSYFRAWEQRCMLFSRIAKRLSSSEKGGPCRRLCAYSAPRRVRVQGWHKAQ